MPRVLVIGGRGMSEESFRMAAAACREAGFTLVEFGEACKHLGLALKDVGKDELAKMSTRAYKEKLEVTLPVDKRPYYRRFEKRKR